MKISNNTNDKTVVKENPKNKFVSAFETPFGLITRRDLENHYGVLK